MRISEQAHHTHTITQAEFNRFAAHTAVSWGLATRVVPAEQLRETAVAVAQEIAAKKAGSIRRTRRLLHIGRDALAARLDAELEAFVAERVGGAGLAGSQVFHARPRQAPAAAAPGSRTLGARKRSTA